MKIFELKLNRFAICWADNDDTLSHATQNLSFYHSKPNNRMVRTDSDTKHSSRALYSDDMGNI